MNNKPGRAKNVVISGAGGNLGRTVVKELLSCGYNIVSLCRAEHEQSLLEDFLNGVDHNDSHEILVGDLNNSNKVKENIDRAASLLESIDVLLVLSGGFLYKEVEETTEKDYDFMFSSNMKVSWLLSKFALKHMRQQNFGRIIMMSSRVTEGIGEEGMSLYSASKAALNMYLRCLTRETRKENITVNTIYPTKIDTMPNREAMPDEDFKDWVSTESIANVIMNLISDDSSAINGAHISIPGKV